MSEAKVAGETSREQPQPQDIVFPSHPAPSLRTEDTPASNLSNVDPAVDFFFSLTKIGEERKRVCKLCADIHGWEKVPKGVTNFIYKTTSQRHCHNHLVNEHTAIYNKTVQENSWSFPRSTEKSRAKTTVDTLREHAPPQITSEVFIGYLIRFIIADGQSIRIVDCREFRDLCMVLLGRRQDTDIPHRERLQEAIIENWHHWFKGLMGELKDTAGRISFTADVWSSGTLSPYLALTAHWISEGQRGDSLTLKTALIGFHKLKKRHGKDIARNILHLLDRAGVTGKTGYFTVDNSENYAVAMRELDALVKHREPSFKFDHLNNRVRSLSQIIDICASHIIASCTRVSKKYLKSLVSEDDTSFFNIGNDDDDDDGDGDDADDGDESSDNILRRLTEDIRGLELRNSELDRRPEEQTCFSDMMSRCDPIKRARMVVRILRSSDQKKEDFKQLIKNGNKNEWFRDANSSVVKVPELELLCDVKNRWDSTYAMIERLLVLRRAIDSFFNMNESLGFKLTNADWDLLEGIGAVLQVPYRVKQAMNSEPTFMLSSAVVVFEVLVSQWEDLSKKHSILTPLIEVGLNRAMKYYGLADNANVLMVTMFLNPCARFQCIGQRWESSRARNIITQLMSEYRRKQISSSTARAAFQGAAAAVPTIPLKSSTLKPSTPEPSAFPTYSNNIEFKDMMSNALGRANVYHSEGTIEAEYEKYASGMASPHNTDILRFWELNKTEFPTLYAIAMDYLPIQASFIQCEHIISLKDADIYTHDQIHPAILEILQTRKFSLKENQQSIGFTNRWKTEVGMMSEAPKATEEDYLVQLLTGDHIATTDTLLHAFDNGQSSCDS